MSSFKSTKTFKSLRIINDTSLNNVSLNKNSIVQATSVTSGVTLNSPAGCVTTVSQSCFNTTGSVIFQVTNSSVTTDSLVLGNIVHYSGTGTPLAHFRDVTTGSFKVSIQNAHPSAALNATVKIGYTIF